MTLLAMVAAAVLSLPTVGVSAGEVFSMPMTLEGACDTVGWAATVEFDPDVIEPTGAVTFTDFVGGLDGYSVRDGSVTLTQLAYPGGTSGDGVLAWVEFRAMHGGETPLAFAQTRVIGVSDGWQEHEALDGGVSVRWTLWLPILMRQGEAVT